ncbi:MAG: porin family protein [Leptospirales bacterium]|nr:porin family protein [Leptospirales bacterium]
MKTKLLLSVFILCLASASAFAFVDASLYGGYTTGGKFDGNSVKHKGDFRYGGLAHLNTSFLALLQFGLGGFFQMSSVTYGSSGTKNFTADKTDIGIDAYAAFWVPFTPLSLYARGGSAAWNKIKFDGTSKTGNFEKHHAGCGLLFTVLPIPLFKLQLFSEYVRVFGKEGGKNSSEHQVNLGVRADLL